VRTLSLLVSLVCGCAATAPEVRAPRAPRALATSRCDLEGSVLRCRWAPGWPPAVVATDAVAHALRLGGGVFVLTGGGRLERHDRHGRHTGGVETALRSLVAVGPYACGVVAGSVACFRDRHEDLTCGSARFEPAPEPVTVVPAEPLSGGPEKPVLRAGARAYRIGGTCDQHCVRLGCDGPRRCLDACGPGEVPRLLVVPVDGAPEDFFSK